MSPSHGHPNSLEASSWARVRRMSSSSSNASGQTHGLLDVSNRPQQYRETDSRPARRPQPRMRQRPLAPLGTREDVEDENYVSPLGSMFGRAFERYRTAEETRRQALQADRNLATSNENITPNPLRSRATNVTDNYTPADPRYPDHLDYAMTSQEYTMVPRPGLANSSWLQYAEAEIARHPESRPTEDQNRAGDEPTYQSVHRIDLAAGAHTLEINFGSPFSMDAEGGDEERPQTSALTMDNQGRPPPTPSDDMIVNIACTICREHPINIVLLPCRHAGMCKWCADICVPVRRGTQFVLPPVPGQFQGKCPKCRRVVRERREIFLG